MLEFACCPRSLMDKAELMKAHLIMEFVLMLEFAYSPS